MFDQRKFKYWLLLGTLVAFAGIVVRILLYNAPVSDISPAFTHPSGLKYAGSASCQSCHADIYQLHQQTPHHLTSRPANATSIAGNFTPPDNQVRINETMWVTMEARDSGFFQVAHYKTPGGEISQAKEFDITVGSGKEGQTYLYWQNDFLYQLPVSYHRRSDSWINSPGYGRDSVYFSRPIQGACLECHSTAFQNLVHPTLSNAYQKDLLLLGVDCERCHGPAYEHVKFHQENPAATESEFIISIKSLSRQQRLDACGLCHSGLRLYDRQSFDFITGDTLAKYGYRAPGVFDRNRLDVHGNQYGLLTASKCFINSPEMDCGSCHQPHSTETGQLTLFSQRCQGCHPDTHQGNDLQENLHYDQVKTNCIDCHMPELPSGDLVYQLQEEGKTEPAMVRTHLVAVYPQVSQELIEQLKKLPEEDDGSK